MRLSFQEDLEQLEASLQEEGALVLRALRSALNAVARGDTELADEVIGFDDEIDRRYFAIEHGVQSLLARQTPVAIDLRLVLAVLRVNLHLERMADYCVTVAKLTKLMGELAVSDESILQSIEDMGRLKSCIDETDHSQLRRSDPVGRAASCRSTPTTTPSRSTGS